MWMHFLRRERARGYFKESLPVGTPAHPPSLAPLPSLSREQGPRASVCDAAHVRGRPAAAETVGHQRGEVPQRFPGDLAHGLPGDEAGRGCEICEFVSCVLLVSVSRVSFNPLLLQSYSNYNSKYIVCPQNVRYLQS